MSDTTTTPAPVDDGDDGYGDLVDIADLPPDEVPDDEREEVQWLTTGGMRCRIDGTWHWLRRPNMGELRKLHKDLAQLKDETTTWIEEARQKAEGLARELGAVSREFRETYTTVTDGDGSDTTEAGEHLNDLAVRVAELQRAQERAFEDITLYRWDFGEKWWRQVFKTLRRKDGPPVPKSLPSWVANPDMQVKALDHWMRVPLGRGGHRKNGR